MTQAIQVELERMRPGQVAEARKRADVAFLPLGTLEWHGPHNPLGLDSLKAFTVCVEAVRLLGGGAVAPALTLGVPRDSFDVARRDVYTPKTAAALEISEACLHGFCSHGGMDIQEQWLFYQRLVRMSLETIAGFGFRSIYIVAGHAPLVHFARPVAVTFTRASSMAGQMVTVDFGGEPDAAGLRTDHGGLWETSILMAACPGTVDLEQLRSRPEYLGIGSATDALESSAAHGKELIQRCAKAIAAEARWLVDHYPELPERHRHIR